jgi:hypothetical protein
MLMRCTLIALLILGAIGLHAGELLDRMVATVNNHVILQSDWDDEVRFECFMAGRKVGDVSPDERRAALHRLIDQEILREQMHITDMKPAGTEAVEKQIAALKNEHLREHAGESWEAALSRYQITDKVVEEHVTVELEQFQLIDARFRSSIQVSPTEVEKYYREQIAPKLPASDSLNTADAMPKIREILVQDKMNHLLDTWLETLHSQAQIRVLSGNEASNSKPSQVEAQ